MKMWKILQNPVPFVLILFSIKLITCESEIYGFGLGSRQAGDELVYTTELESNDSLLWPQNFTVDFSYTATEPVSCIQLRTAYNLYTEVIFQNAYTIYIRLTEFDSISFNATLYVYGYPYGIVPDDFHPLLKAHPKILDQNKPKRNEDFIDEEIARDYDAESVSTSRHRPSGFGRNGNSSSLPDFSKGDMRDVISDYELFVNGIGKISFGNWMIFIAFILAFANV